VSLEIKYENAEDAKMRLRQSVVLYKGEPVLITDVRAGGGGKDDVIRVLIQDLPVGNVPKEGFIEKARKRVGIEDEDAAERRKYISSKHFDIAPFPLGYVNKQGGNGAFYCSRMPNRIQKQGLCGENFKAVDNYGGAVPFTVFLASKETVAMVKGDYPSFDRALALLDKSRSVAFSRNFALVKDEVIPALIYLYHKGTKVGMFNGREMCLGINFNCLKESLNEMKLKVAA
jgi:hypothetical protein